MRFVSFKLFIAQCLMMLQGALFRAVNVFHASGWGLGRDTL